MKKCNKCKDLISKDDFYKCSTNSDGLQCICKDCTKDRILASKRTKDGLITKVYSAQKSNSAQKGYPPPTYTKRELKEWMFSQQKFHELYDNWKNSGYDTALIPSCDRKDNYLSYTLKNIQLTTWCDNLQNGYDDMRNGINNKNSKVVIGINLITGEKVEFHSTMDAERQTNADHRHISDCCNNIRKSHAGHAWEFKN